ncbi:hypothetical protein DFP72DRAFT_862345 [Ephemerocybe angulata]|uniref:Uncharacterized protein n=1 Tax=Ephemerocybe angulata TaxID=980116 RepID=A0A8H6H8F3_9AGAR|nr:hypothetical protein DFP72DRAFT_862345 [Tulosesus angulatus]
MDMLTTAHTPRRAVDAARGSPPTAYRLRVQCTILGELTTSTSLCTFKYWYSGVRMTVLLKFELTMYTPTQHRLHKYKRVPSKYSESPCTAGASAPNDAHLRRKCARSPVTPRDLQYSASPWICISPDGTHPSVYHRRTRRVLRVLMEHVCPRRTYTCVPSETLDSHCTASPGITLECTPTTHTQKCAVDTVVLHCECEYRALCVSSDSIKQRRQRGYDPTRAVWCESRDSDGSGGPSISSDGIHICVQHVFAVEDSAPTVQCEFGDGHGYDGVGVLSTQPTRVLRRHATACTVWACRRRLCTSTVLRVQRWGCARRHTDMLELSTYPAHPLRQRTTAPTTHCGRILTVLRRSRAGNKTSPDKLHTHSGMSNPPEKFRIRKKSLVPMYAVGNSGGYASELWRICLRRRIDVRALDDIRYSPSAEVDLSTDGACDYTSTAYPPTHATASTVALDEVQGSTKTSVEYEVRRRLPLSTVLVGASASRVALVEVRVHLASSTVFECTRREQCRQRVYAVGDPTLAVWCFSDGILMCILGAYGVGDSTLALRVHRWGCVRRHAVVDDGSWCIDDNTPSTAYTHACVLVDCALIVHNIYEYMYTRVPSTHSHYTAVGDSELSFPATQAIRKQGCNCAVTDDAGLCVKRAASVR